MSSFDWWDVTGIVDKISCNHVGFSPPRGYISKVMAIKSPDFDREVGDTCLMGAKGEMKIGLVGILNFRFHPSSIGILRSGGLTRRREVFYSPTFE
jgi:hypothetical protein